MHINGQSDKTQCQNLTSSRGRGDLHVHIYATVESVLESPIVFRTAADEIV